MRQHKITTPLQLRNKGRGRNGTAASAKAQSPTTRKGAKRGVRAGGKACRETDASYKLSDYVDTEAVRPNQEAALQLVATRALLVSHTLSTCACLLVWLTHNAFAYHSPNLFPQAEKAKKRADEQAEEETVGPNDTAKADMDQPELVTGGTMREYQLAGVSWMKVSLLHHATWANTARSLLTQCARVPTGPL